MPPKFSFDEIIHDVIVNFGEDKNRLDQVQKFKAEWKAVKEAYKERVASLNRKIVETVTSVR
jgi:hypothetical protein